MEEQITMLLFAIILSMIVFRKQIKMSLQPLIDEIKNEMRRRHKEKEEYLNEKRKTKRPP